MAWKDALKSLTGKKKQTELAKKNEAVNTFLTSENFPIIYPTEINLSRYRKVPFMGIATLGTTFAKLPEAARSIVQTVTTNVATSEPVYVGINSKGIEGFLRFNQDGTVGNIMQYNDQGKQVIAGRMRFKELENGIPATQTASTVVPFDPMTVVIAAALIRVEQKLAALQKTAEEILQFLKLEKQSKQRGNLNMLAEIFEEYKQHCDNEKLCSSRNVTVMDIKRETHQNILFYREQIARQLKEQKAIHGAQNAKGLIDSVANEFYEYQLVCYLYAFASFLDVMLQKNFESSSLDAVAKKMQEHSKRYSELYMECHAQLTNYQHTAIEAQILGGLGNIVKSAGQKLAAIPILRDGPVDEALISAAESLGKYNEESVGKKMDGFAPLEDSRMQTFIENVRSIDMLYNQSGSMLMDRDNLYLLEVVS